MEKAIVYKEWIKTRGVFFISLLLAVAMAEYAILAMNRLIALKGVDHLWIVMLAKDNSFIDIIKYVPLAVGIAVAVAQMAPEMSHKRLKLTLHLPYPQMKLIGIMLATGLAEVLVIFAVQILMLIIYDYTIITPEMVWRVALTAMPWYFAGFTAYLVVASVCLEGTWYMRFLLSLIGIAAVMMYFLQESPEAYNGAVAYMLLFTAVLGLFSFGSVVRFKEGRQD